MHIYIVYNILYGTPFAKYDRDWNIAQFIHTGQRAQYVGEGVLITSLFVLGSAMLYYNFLLSSKFPFNNLLIYPKKYNFYFDCYLKHRIMTVNHLKQNLFLFL